MTDFAGHTTAQAMEHSLDLNGSIPPLLPLYLLIFIGFCGYSLMVTLFAPMLMGNSGFLPDAATVTERSLVLGLLLAVYPLGQFVGSPMLGAFSDRYGRRPVLIISLLGSVLGYGVMAFGIEERSFITLGAGCLIGGLAEANIAIAQSAISDVSTPDERPRLFAWTYSSSSLGYIAGPILGGQIALHFGWAVPFWLMVPLLLAALVWLMLSFVETRAVDGASNFSAVDALKNLGALVTDRPVRRLYLLNFLVYIALFGYFRMVLVYVVDRWHAGIDQTTFIYSGLALMSALTSFLMVAPLTRRIGLYRLAMIACVAGGVAMIAITVPHQIGSIWITGGLTTMAGTMALSSCPTILSNAVPAARQGRVLGNNQALQVGAESLSAVTGGALASLATPLPLIVFGVFLLICGLLLWWADEKGQDDQCRNVSADLESQHTQDPAGPLGLEQAPNPR